MTRARVRIKLCGMTRQEDIAYAAHLGVDAIGLIFYARSARAVSIADAKKIARSVPLFLDLVAVFVNPTEQLVKESLMELPINWLQFHGEESPEFCKQFKRPYIKAVKASSAGAIENCIRTHDSAAAILLDTPSEHCYGGTGQAFDWQLVPKNLSKPLILAGGLHVANVKHAIETCLPTAIDVCSGVERSAGIKDHEKMRQLVNTVWGKQ